VHRLPREILRKRDRHRTSTKFRLGVIRWVHELFKRHSYVHVCNYIYRGNFSVRNWTTVNIALKRRYSFRAFTVYSMYSALGCLRCLGILTKCSGPLTLERQKLNPDMTYFKEYQWRFLRNGIYLCVHKHLCSHKNVIRKIIWKYWFIYFCTWILGEVIQHFGRKTWREATTRKTQS
jgi:hypothetical protein